MIRAMLITFSFFLANICSAGSLAEVHIQRMIGKYKSLSSYEDNGGSITNINSSNGAGFSAELRFKTIYLRGESLYFEWLEMPSELEKQLFLDSEGLYPIEPKKNTIYKDKNGVQVNYYFKQKETLNSLSKALSGATGVSSGLAWMVPRYLSPEIPCPPKFGANKVRILNENNKIVSIELTFDGVALEIFHIDKDTYLLKKYEKKRKIDSGTSSYQVVDYNVINYK